MKKWSEIISKQKTKKSNLKFSRTYINKKIKYARLQQNKNL